MMIAIRTEKTSMASRQTRGDRFTRTAATEAEETEAAEATMAMVARAAGRAWDSNCPVSISRAHMGDLRTGQEALQKGLLRTSEPGMQMVQMSTTKAAHEKGMSNHPFTTTTFREQEVREEGRRQEALAQQGQQPLVQGHEPQVARQEGQGQQRRERQQRTRSPRPEGKREEKAAEARGTT